VTNDTHRGISTYVWTEDGAGILYIQDKDGDENEHLYLVPLSAIISSLSSSTAGGSSSSKQQPPQAIDLTPFPGVKASGILLSKRFPDVLYIGLNRRDSEVFDMYRLDLPTRKLTLDTVNPGEITSWLLNHDFQIKVCTIVLDCQTERSGVFAFISRTPLLEPLCRNSSLHPTHPSLTTQQPSTRALWVTTTQTAAPTC